MTKPSEAAPIFVGPAPLHPPGRNVAGRFADLDGERTFVVDDVDALPPFLMTVPSAGDHWMFVSSNGALTCGRRSPDEALFPYTTDDRVHDSGEHTGGKTILRVHEGDRRLLWEPFSVRGAGLYRISRRLGKSVTGNKLRFEEVNHDLGLTFACTWMTSERFGFVRQVSLVNDTAVSRTLDVLDGLQNLLPPGLGRRFQLEYSTLGDAYKEAELDPETGLGLFRLASIPSDAAEPNEALLATTIWARGLPGATLLLSGAQLEPFRRGQALLPETRVRGQRGAFFAAGTLTLSPGRTALLTTVANLGQDVPAVVATQRWLRGDAPVGEVLADVERGTRALVDIVAAADGLSKTADERETTRHFSNVLYNNMRGGLPADGYRIERADFSRFVAETNRRVFARQQSRLTSLPETLPHRELLALARASGDPDFERIAHEYLPLTFSRRHGDPSRPWNIFAIDIADETGRRRLGYQGNWRDIFQNWEALALSFPGYLESMIFKFLDASTADGHNPYRLTRQGFEWEVKDPRDPWSHIGYWGDHQVIYLFRLLELSERYHPGALARLLDRRLFTYADVPYRIKPFDDLIVDPQDSIVFDQAAHEAALARAARLGAEGKTLVDGSGNPVRATLTEKLLVLVLAKLGNYVPEAGVWMNTQRPEWNDAQNALVGNGASLVTLCYLRRFLHFARCLFAQGGGEVAVELAQALRGVAAGLSSHDPAAPASDQRRRAVLEALARPLADFRARLYAAGFSGQREMLAPAALVAFCDLALPHIDASLRRSRRADGLYHAYNLVKFAGDGISVRRLPEMLEGQVAALSSGALSPALGSELLDALAKSALYRADQGSYLLYPDRQLPGFLAKNRVPAAAVTASPLFSRLLERHDGRLVVRDEAGDVHFASGLRNARVLGELLTRLAAEGSEEERAEVSAERAAILALYETVFDHQSFTGRAGSFYKYEGLGCIYWHMNSKLLLAVQELLMPALRAQTPPAVVARLVAHHEAIRAGLGLHKSPAQHGALPTDPYSHTPAHAGAQQPGLTGQVKEDILVRARALGAVVEEGRLSFDPVLLPRGEFLTAPAAFPYVDVTGSPRQLALSTGSLAFTISQVPVVFHRGLEARLVVHRSDGVTQLVPGLALDHEQSRALFERRDEIRLIEVFVETSLEAARG